jgi:hypothetical protein
MTGVGLCGSASCGCAFTGDGTTIDITGSGEPGDPFVISGSPVANPVARVYLADASWVKPSGVKYVLVECIGGGGGSGGGAATGASQASAGGGGGGGGYTRKLVLAAALGASETVTVGAGGSAGAAGNNAGGAGSGSSFGAHCVANAGTAGAGSGVIAYGGGFCANGGAGGASHASGDLSIPGSNGVPVASFNRMIRSPGGASALTPGITGAVTTTTLTGVAGFVPGGGAAGGVNTASQSAVAGAVGGAGAVIVYEFYG